MNDTGEYLDVYAKGHLDILAVGAELGYQFLIGKHFTVDLVMIGPAMARYGNEVNIRGDDNL